jgi:hypothetical protein
LSEGIVKLLLPVCVLQRSLFSVLCDFALFSVGFALGLPVLAAAHVARIAWRCAMPFRFLSGPAFQHPLSEALSAWRLMHEPCVM